MVQIIPVTAPEDGLVYTAGNIKLKIGEKVIGYGVLYLSQYTLAWQPDDRQEGIVVDWKSINVHGISTTPTKCLYFMIDQDVHWPGVYEPRGVNGNARNGNHMQVVGEEPMEQQQNAEDAAAAADDEEDEGNVTDEEDFDNPLTECWLYPDDLNTVEVIFRAMNDCQELNPDPADSVSEESDFMDDDDEEVLNMHDPNNEDNDDADGAQGHMRNLNINDNNIADAGDPS